MILEQLLKDNKIQKIDFSINEVKTKLDRAFAFFNYAQNNLNRGDTSVIYANIYDSVRIAGESILMFFGFKINKGEGHHFIVISASKELINDLESEFLRFEKMRRKRHDIEYGDLFVSSDELNQAIEDAKKLLDKIKELISDKDSQKKLL